MKNETIRNAAALAVTSMVAIAAEDAAISQMLSGLKSQSDDERRKALEAAGPLGAKAVEPLAGLLISPETEDQRSAKRALYKVVYHAGRPGAEAKEAKSIEKELLKQLDRKAPAQFRREILWLLSEIGGDDSVAPIENLLKDADVQDDARMVLQRIPGAKSLAALKKGYEAASPEFKKNLAESLTKRGVEVPGFKSEKLKPVKPSTLKLS